MNKIIISKATFSKLNLKPSIRQQGGDVRSIIIAFAQATQQDPNTIIQQLQQMPSEEQQQALEAMMQQLQGGQEATQQGGKIYMQEAGVIDPFLQNSTLLADFTNAPQTIQTLPYTPRDTNPNKIWQGENYGKVWKPLVEKSMANPEQAKKIDAWLMANKGTFAPNVQKQLEGLTGEKRLERIKALATDEKPGLFHNAVLDAIKATSPPTALTPTMPEYNYGETAIQQTPQVAPDNTFGFMPYITPPSPRQGVILETATPPQYERAKRSFEQGQASLENQLEARRQQLAASGLNPMQQEALMANEAANTQEATNRNIASVEQFNAQSKADTTNRQEDANFKTNLFNIGQRDTYFTRNTAAQDNAEIAQKQYNDAYNKLGYRTQQDLFNKSLVNASADNYRINNDGSITFLPPQVGDTSPDNTAYWEAFTKLTPQEQVAETKRLSAEKLARINAEKKQKALQNRK